MQYTVRAFIEGRDERLDEMCRTFSSMERASYNFMREGSGASDIKALLRQRYGIQNARWIQSALNQAGAVVDSKEEGIKYRIDQCLEKIQNTNEKIIHLSNELKISGCQAKINKLQKRVDGLRQQLKDKSYPRAIFGSSGLLHRLSIAKGREGLKKEWKEKRSNHFFSVGQANQRGNGNTRLIRDDDIFYLEIRNWFEDDFKLLLHVPEYATQVLPQLIDRSDSVKLGKRGEITDGGLAYSIRVIRNGRGYQVLISFELVEPEISWHERLAGIDINPEGIACTVISKDGNLIGTRFFRDNRLISASKNKRKWMLENLINKMLRWCACNYNCNALAVEDLKFKGAYDRDSKTNYKLSNFMKKKMIEVIKLHALKMNMLVLEVKPAFTSMVAIAKYGKQFGGFNRHQLAAFVIGRRALGYAEYPTAICLPKTKKEKRMWSYCSKSHGYLSQLQTLLQHEPMEWKSARADKGGGTVTELLIARPASTNGLSHINASTDNRVGVVPVSEISGRQAGSDHPNPQAREGDGATGHRVSPAPNGVDNLL